MYTLIKVLNRQNKSERSEVSAVGRQQNPALLTSCQHSGQLPQCSKKDLENF